MRVTEWLRLQADRAGAWVAIVAGVVLIVVGWIGVSDTAYPAEQIPYAISGGVGGMFLLGLGAMLWLSADMRDEWTKLDRIEEVLREQGWRGLESGEAVPATTADQIRVVPEDQQNGRVDRAASDLVS